MRCWQILWFVCRKENILANPCRHLLRRIDEHTHSAIDKYLRDEHNLRPSDLHGQFLILKKCRGKLVCLSYEMLLIRNKRATLNTRVDFIRAKLFIKWTYMYAYRKRAQESFFNLWIKVSLKNLTTFSKIDNKSLFSSEDIQSKEIAVILAWKPTND